MKRCSESLVISEIQIKTTMKCHFIPTGMATLLKKINVKDVEKVKPSHIAGGNVKVTAAMENSRGLGKVGLQL